MTEVTKADLALLAFARNAQEKAYAPYSNFRVGAAIFAGGEIYEGCNVENAAYGSTVCAERGAAMAAVLAGSTFFDSIAVVGDSQDPTVPCGACRQFLAEFNPEMRVVMGGSEDHVRVATLEELLPDAFVRGYLDQDAGVR
jgi:cytidine deaminase